MMFNQTTTEPLTARGLSPQEAIVSLLIASARADGSVSLHEANQIEHVVGAMKLFRGFSDERLRRLFTTAAECITEHGVAPVVQRAAATVPKELRATTFALTADLMLSDGRLSVSERRFADELRVLLKLEPEATARILDVLKIKNAG